MHDVIHASNCTHSLIILLLSHATSFIILLFQGLVDGWAAATVNNHFEMNWLLNKSTFLLMIKEDIFWVVPLLDAPGSIYHWKSVIQVSESYEPFNI